MNCFAPAIVVAALSLCPAIAAAEEPDFKFKFIATRRNTVEVISVDPKGLAWQMGLKKDDTGDQQDQDCEQGAQLLSSRGTDNQAADYPITDAVASVGSTSGWKRRSLPQSTPP